MRRFNPPLLAAIALLASACTDEMPPPIDRPQDLVQRPSAVQSVDFAATEFPMLSGWDASSAWHVVVHPDGRTLAGGTAGLFLLGETIEQLDTTPVLGLLSHDELGFVVVTAEGVKIYSDALYDSAINEMLDGLEVRGVARRGSALWFATDAELYELEGESLFSYPDLQGIESVRTHDDSSLVVVQSPTAITLLRAETAGITGRAISDELADMALASPGPQERLFAIATDERALLERVSSEQSSSWFPVALSDDAADAGALGIDAVAADPVGGALWLTQGTLLYRIDGGGVVSSVVWPSAVQTSGRIVATTDGAVWMSEGERLFRVGPQSPPPSYAQQMVPFYQDNCANCHESGGDVVTVTRFGDYESFAANIETIIEQVESGLMPAGNNDLIGDPELPRQWRDGGLRP